MTQSADTLFLLLRAAIGTGNADFLPSGIDWQKVIDLAFDQGVAAVTVDGIGKATKTKTKTKKGMGTGEVKDC